MLKGVHQKLEPQETPAFFIRGANLFSRILFYCALSIILMAIDARFNYLSQIRQTFIAALHPFEVIANTPSEWLRDTKKYFSQHNALIQENYALKQQAVEHQVKLQQLATIQAENSHLKRLFHSGSKLDPKAILGEISHMGRDPFSHVVVINRGSKHQILAGQAVVDANGVIGQVTRVYPFSSEVTMITDKNLSIPIQIERNQMRAIAFGEGSDNTLDLPFLPTNVDIKVGDKLVTSGIDGIYPAGLAVASVTKINQSPDSPFAKIICTPTAGVKNHLQLLILSLPEEPIDEIKEEPQAIAIDPKKIMPKKDLSKPVVDTKKPTLIKPLPNASR